MDGYRANAGRERCRDCGEPACAVCARCNASLCREHEHGERARCSECELELQRRLPASNLAPWKRAGWILSTVALVSEFFLMSRHWPDRYLLYTMVPLLFVVVLGVPLMWLAGVVVEGIAYDRERRGFLRERIPARKD